MAKRDRVAFDFSMTLMTRAFRDLATSFAALNADAADRAIHNIEAMVARELQALLQKPPEGVTVRDVKLSLTEVVAPLREMTQGARGMIQQAGKPKH